MSDILGKLKSGAEKIAEEADEALRIKRIELQIGSINKQIEEQYVKLGQITYESRIKNEPENLEAAGLIAKVTELKQQIVAKEEDIKKMKKDKEGKAAPPPATVEKKFCSNCGKENAIDSKFCVHCGAKIE